LEQGRQWQRATRALLHFHAWLGASLIGATFGVEEIHLPLCRFDRDRESFMSLKLKVAVAALFVVTMSLAHAAVRHVCKVGCAYATIQGAVNAAASGDQIDNAPGVYVENVSIAGKELVLVGSGSGLTVVDGSSARASVFTLGEAAGGGTAQPVTLRNLTIARGNTPAYGGGILVQGSAGLNLESSVVIGHSAAAGGGGIEMAASTGPANRLVNSRVEGNSVASEATARGQTGGGIDVQTGVTLEISGSTIDGNSTYGNGAGLFSTIDTHLSITTSTFSNNTAHRWVFREQHNTSFGGGIDAASDTAITDCAVYGNAADFGGGVRITLSGTQPHIKNTTIARNAAGAGSYEPYTQEGGGVFVDTYSRGAASYGTLTLDHVYVSNNDDVYYHTADNIATSSEFGSANFRVLLIDTTVGDPSNSSCIGGLCGT
jgi:hypothetical protein